MDTWFLCLLISFTSNIHFATVSQSGVIDFTKCCNRIVCWHCCELMDPISFEDETIPITSANFTCSFIFLILILLYPLYWNQLRPLNVLLEITDDRIPKILDHVCMNLP